MKFLTLFRHAKSSWKHPVADLHRPLNGRGLQQAWHMASHCSLEVPDKIITSPASRALATAMIYVDRMRIAQNALEINSQLYESCSDTLLHVISETSDEVQQLWLFGHNPGLNALLDTLLGHRTENLVTAAYAHLALPISSWGEMTAGRATLQQWNDERG